MLSKISAVLSIACMASHVLAAPAPTFHRREVPQEHSHKPILVATKTFLDLDNPDGIIDPIFGLLGAAAAATGAGNIADADCLQQATADRAFTNAKNAGDVDGQVAALLFRALERNTGSVGLASVPCTSIQAVNPEIAAIQQHQDPASDNAAAINKAITLELARQIAAVGGDPLQALLAGTFAPGQIGDPTARGNSCNVEDDAEGCIFSQNLLVEDATEEEIAAAVADVTPPADNGEQCPTPTTVTVTAGAIQTGEAIPTATVTGTAVPSITAAPGRGNGRGHGRGNNRGNQRGADRGRGRKQAAGQRGIAQLLQLLQAARGRLVGGNVIRIGNGVRH